MPRIFTRQFIRAGLIVLLSLSIIVYVGCIVSTILFPYTIDYGEAPIIDHARRILVKEPLYKSELTISPYIITNYPPIYPYLLAYIARLTGFSLLVAGRIISILATLAAASMLASLAKSLTRDALSALFTTGLFLGHPYVITWSPLARVDMLALFFCILALFILYHRWRSWGWSGVALICFLAAIYTRQSYLLAGPLAASTWLWSRDHRRAIIFSSILIIASTGIFLVINHLTNGGFYLNIIQANLNQYDFTHLAKMSQHFFLIWPIVLPGSLLYAGVTVARQSNHTSQPNLEFLRYGWLIFTLGSILATATAGKVGASVNYYLETIAALSLLGSLAFHSVKPKTTFIQGMIYLGVVSQLIWILAGTLFLFKSRYNDNWGQLGWYDQVAARVYLAAEEGPILSDDYLGMVVQAGQPVIYQPFEYGQLYQAGLWDPGLLAQDINAGYFSLILIGGDTLIKPCCWPPELVQAIQSRYRIEYQPGLVVCTPHE